MEDTPLISKDTASPVAQVKQGRVLDLGRGSSSKSLLQSPTTPCSPPSGSEKGDAIASGSGNQAVDSSQQIALRLEASGLTKTQRRNLKKRLKLKEKLARQITCKTPSGAGIQGTDVVKQITHETLGGAGNSGTNGAKQTTCEISSGAGRKDNAGEGGKGTKRLWSVGSTPSPAFTVAAKKPRRDPLLGGHASMVTAVKMAVVKEGFPNSRLSSEEATIVDQAIIEMIDQAPFEVGGPRMLGSAHSTGALIINCNDSQTVEWLKKNVDGSKKVLRNVALNVISTNDLPKPCKVAFKTRDVYTKSPSVILTRLERLNPNLKSRQWRVLQHTANDHYSRWIFEVEMDDVEDIRRANFTAFIGLDRGIFKILQEPGKKAVEGEKDSSLGMK